VKEGQLERLDEEKRRGGRKKRVRERESIV
jgi:hypothetical protein